MSTRSRCNMPGPNTASWVIKLRELARTCVSPGQRRSRLRLAGSNRHLEERGLKTGGLTVAVTALQNTPNRADYLEHERRSRLGGWRKFATLLLNPAAAWGIALLTTLTLWWGIWLAVSSLVSALL
jgi:hypothetical protein